MHELAFLFMLSGAERCEKSSIRRHKWMQSLKFGCFNGVAINGGLVLQFCEDVLKNWRKERDVNGSQLPQGSTTVFDEKRLVCSL